MGVIWKLASDVPFSICNEICKIAGPQPMPGSGPQPDGVAHLTYSSSRNQCVEIFQKVETVWLWG